MPDGESPEILRKAPDLNPSTVYKCLTKYHYGGLDALKAEPIAGCPPKLSNRQLTLVLSETQKYGYYKAYDFCA